MFKNSASASGGAPREGRASKLMALTAAAAIMLSACGPSGATGSDSGPAAEGPHSGGTIHVLQQEDFSYLDPARGWDAGVAQIYRLLYRGLTTQAAGDADNPAEVVPDLATDLGTVSDDGTTWTFTLKDGLEFDNGDPITAQAVKFGISRAWDPQIGIGSPYLKDKIAAPKDYRGPYQSGDLTTIETPDEKTVVFHLKAPFPEFPAVLAQPNGAPFPVGSGKGDEFLKNVIASGPYSLDKYTPGSLIRLVKNENWDPATDDVREAYPDSFEFNLGIDPATIDERLIADQGDDVNAIASGITKASIARLQEPHLKKRLLEAPGVCTSYMSMNTAEGPFADVGARRAVNLALDREMVVNAVGGSAITEATTTIIPKSVNGHIDFDLYPGPDIGGAQAELAKTAHPDGFEFTLDIASSDATKDRALAIQESLKSVGIEAKLNVIDTAIFYETVQTPAKAHDAALSSWCPDWSSSASTFIPPLFSTAAITDKGNQNLAQFSDKSIDARIKKASALTDPVEANSAWGDLDKAIMEEAPWAPLTVGKALLLPGSNLANVIPSDDLLDLSIMGLKDPEKGQ